MMLEKLQGRRGLADVRAMYLIRVLGNLDIKWLDYFDDISIVVTQAPGASNVSTVYTHNSDQAAVMGILNSLYQYGYPLLAVELLDVV